jgi:hypothetical protein
MVFLDRAFMPFVVVGLDQVKLVLGFGHVGVAVKIVHPKFPALSTVGSNAAWVAIP